MAYTGAGTCHRRDAAAERARGQDCHGPVRVQPAVRVPWGDGPAALQQGVNVITHTSHREALSWGTGGGGDIIDPNPPNPPNPKSCNLLHNSTVMHGLCAIAPAGRPGRRRPAGRCAGGGCSPRPGAAGSGSGPARPRGLSCPLPWGPAKQLSPLLIHREGEEDTSNSAVTEELLRNYERLSYFTGKRRALAPRPARRSRPRRPSDSALRDTSSARRRASAAASLRAHASAAWGSVASSLQKQRCQLSQRIWHEVVGRWCTATTRPSPTSSRGRGRATRSACAASRRSAARGLGGRGPLQAALVLQTTPLIRKRSERYGL
jgi:hypothetical protein